MNSSGKKKFTHVSRRSYPRIYTDDAVILFQDGKQRRYVSTVDYNIKKLFDERELTDKVLGFHIEEPGLVLHCSEHTELKPENLQAFQRIPESEEFQMNIRNVSERSCFLIIPNTPETEEADNYLRQMDYKEICGCRQNSSSGSTDLQRNVSAGNVHCFPIRI